MENVAETAQMQSPLNLRLTKEMSTYAPACPTELGQELPRGRIPLILETYARGPPEALWNVKCKILKFNL